MSHGESRELRQQKRVNQFDRRLLRRFVATALPYWFSKEKWFARGLVALLVVLLIGDTEFNVFFNKQSGEFTSALAAQDSTRFWHSIRLFVGCLVFAVPIYAFYYFVRDTLGNHWRRWLTHDFLRKYFANRTFYDIASSDVIDNPDQRISEDINAFTEKSLSFLMVLTSAVFQLFAFSHVLWSISRALVAFLVAYAAIGTAVTLGVFGKRMVWLNFRQLKREADFRFGLVRIRENAESIAFYRGEAQESEQVKHRFLAVFDNFKAIIRWTLKLNFFQYGYSLTTLVLPSVIIGPRVLSGELEVGRVVQAAGAFSAIFAALTLVINNFESLSRFAAGINRLRDFDRALSSPAERRTHADPVIAITEDSRLAFEGVTLLTPNRERTLVKDLTLSLPPGEGLLVVGASGGGKSSLLRAIAGLWEAGTGTIVRPKPEDMLFLPQHAYMILGTLRAQLLYPGHAREITDDELRDVLERVNLPNLEQQCGGFDGEVQLDKVLSIGEQQRLAFARVLLRKPKFAMLDEATSALDAENEAALYRQLKETATTPISVSHRPAILQYHQQVLELGGNGTWHVQAAADYRFDPDLLGD